MRYLKSLIATAPEDRVLACAEDPSLLDAALAEASVLLGGLSPTDALCAEVRAGLAREPELGEMIDATGGADWIVLLLRLLARCGGAAGAPATGLRGALLRLAGGALACVEALDRRNAPPGAQLTTEMGGHAAAQAHEGDRR